MWRNKFTSAELIERHEVTDSLAIFRFSLANRPSFDAGQYATLAIEADDAVLERPYSIASSPYENFLEFFVELVPKGLFTPRLWDLRLGSTILIRQRIVGQLTLDRNTNKHVMMATVTGVAPFVSMLRTHQIELARGTLPNHQFVVIHGSSSSADFGPYLTELEELSRQGWMTYIPTISRPWEESNWLGETGRIEDVVRKHADGLGFDHTNSVAYVCGHPIMVENVKALLLRARFTSNQLKEEEYFLK